MLRALILAPVEIIVPEVPRLPRLDRVPAAGAIHDPGVYRTRPPLPQRLVFAAVAPLLRLPRPRHQNPACFLESGPFAESGRETMTVRGVDRAGLKRTPPGLLCGITSPHGAVAGERVLSLFAELFLSLGGVRPDGGVLLRVGGAELERLLARHHRREDLGVAS